MARVMFDKPLQFCCSQIQYRSALYQRLFLEKKKKNLLTIEDVEL